MTALIIIFAVIVFLAIILLIPINIYLDYDGENTKFWVRYGFIKYNILPQKSKKEKKPKPKKEKTKTKEKNSNKKEKEKSSNPFSGFLEENGVGGLIEVLCEVLRIVKDFSSSIRRNLIVKKLSIAVVVGGDDAYQTAMNFGYMCSGVYPVVGGLSALLEFKKLPEIDIKADFDSKQNKANLFFQLSIKPLNILTSAGIYGIKALKLYMKITATNTKTENQKKQ